MYHTLCKIIVKYIQKVTVRIGGKSMLDFFYANVDETTAVLCGLAIILFAGFAVTRVTNLLKLPKVSGYIIAGILAGPGVLNLVPGQMISHMGFLNDVALAFIAFGAGKFFKKKVLVQTGWRVIVITVSEAMAAGVLVMLCMRLLFHMDWSFALMLGAIATATAPASTLMTINQYRAKGEFVNILLQVVALDDVVCLMAYSIAITVINAGEGGKISFISVAMPLVLNILSLGFGLICGLLLGKLITPARSRDNRIILVLAMLLGMSGICTIFDISPLLACMAFGASYINLTQDKKLYRQVQNFTPPVMSLFFIISGMQLDLKAISTAGLIGVAYFFVRIIGKYLGTYISCRVTKVNIMVRKYLGFALIPQAGVAIGLAFLGQRQLSPDRGSLLLTIILSSSVLYELTGPAAAKWALIKAGVIREEKKKVGGEPEEMKHRESGLEEKKKQHAGLEEKEKQDTYPGEEKKTENGPEEKK